jgi:predicted transcriptional regulator
VEHYKACAEGSDDGIADLLSTVHAAIMSVPLDAGFCPSRWKDAVDVMLEKIPGVSRSDKLRIIQLLQADLNQVLIIAIARNIGRLAK